MVARRSSPRVESGGGDIQRRVANTIHAETNSRTRVDGLDRLLNA